ANPRGHPVPAVSHASHATAVGLAPPSTGELAQIQAPSKGAPMQVAFGRDVARAGSAALFHGLLDWETLPSGNQVSAVSFTSPGASAVRVGLRVVGIPPGAVFRFHGPTDTDMFEVQGDEILEAIASNLDSGDHGPDAHTYWSPAIDGESAVVEIELPA